jgi:hypothetical protein
MWQEAQDWLKKKLTGQAAHSADDGSGARKRAQDPAGSANPCCNQSTVHIAFRGKSDDRMYIAYKREWQELRYYQANGLRVFCSVCRRRLV